MSNKFSILNFFFSKLFFKHLFLSLCAVIFFLLSILFYLKIYTNHNNNIVLPSFIGENISDVDSLINSLSLRYLIIDSIYDRNKLPGEIITQDPLPGISVKENRRIYLSIIAENQQKITMPNLIDLTHRSAIEKINSIGFQVGELSYIPNIAKNAVLKRLVNNSNAIIGNDYPVGTKIDLVLGNGLSQTKVELPYLIDLSYNDAELALQLNSLNIGIAVFNTDVLDSNNAIVYKQKPSFKENRFIKLGTDIDIFLKNP